MVHCRALLTTAVVVRPRGSTGSHGQGRFAAVKRSEGKRPDMGETIGIGIVGAGGIAEHAHVPAYLEQPDARLVAVADVVPERARALAEKNGIPRAYGSLEELLLDPDVDAVSITTPNAYHAPTAIAAPQAGGRRARGEGTLLLLQQSLPPGGAPIAPLRRGRRTR